MSRTYTINSSTCEYSLRSIFWTLGFAKNNNPVLAVLNNSWEEGIDGFKWILSFKEYSSECSNFHILLKSIHPTVKQLSQAYRCWLDSVPELKIKCFIWKQDLRPCPIWLKGPSVGVWKSKFHYITNGLSSSRERRLPLWLVLT